MASKKATATIELIPSLVQGPIVVTFEGASWMNYPIVKWFINWGQASGFISGFFTKEDNAVMNNVPVELGRTPILREMFYDGCALGVKCRKNILLATTKGLDSS